jgi:hypothetical protein
MQLLQRGTPSYLFFLKVSTGVIVVLVLQEALLLGAINVSKVNVHVWNASPCLD